MQGLVVLVLFKQSEEVGKAKDETVVADEGTS
jgi:hypothetical protein